MILSSGCSSSPTISMSGRFLLEHRAGLRVHRLAERIVLIDQIELLDIGTRLHEIRQRRHLDVGIGVPAKMPIGTFGVGQNRIDRRIIEVEYFLAGIAVVVLGHPVRQRRRDRRAVALRDDADALIGGLLRLDQTFLRIGLVVERDDFEFLALRAAGGVQLIGEVLERLQADLADRRAASRQRIDVADFYRLIRERRAGDKTCRQSQTSHFGFHRLLPCRPCLA